MGAYSKLLGLWSPLFRSLGCDSTILHLPDFDQLTVANLVNLILMEEPPDSFVRFNMEQMELFECLNIKLSGLTEIPGDVEIKKVEVNEVKRATRSSGALVKNVAKPPEKVKVAPPVKVSAPPEVEAEEPVSYMCDLCDSKVTSIEKHMESEHEEIMPIPIEEIASFFTIIPVIKVPQKAVDNEKVSNSSASASIILRKSESDKTLPLQKSEASSIGVGRGFKYDGAEGVKCPECPRRFITSGNRQKDNLRCHIGNIHFSDRLLADAATYYISNKCKECGHNGKSNALKKKHMLFHHTKYVSEIISITENAIKSQDKDEKKKENTEALLEEELPPKVEDMAGGGKRKREEGDSEEERKSLKLDPQLKVVDLEKLTATAHAEVEDLLMSDNEDNDLEDARDKDADAKEGNWKEDAEEAFDDDNVEEGQSSEVLSIQDQLLQMQDLSSEEDEDEDADDRLKEFAGEGLSEEESEDLDDEKADEKVEDGDYDIDVGNLISDEDIADDIADDETPGKEQEKEEFLENEPAEEMHNDDLGNISDDEEEASEDNLEDVLNFENDEDDDDGDSETAPNSDQEDENEEFASVMSTEMLEKLNNLLSS